MNIFDFHTHVFPEDVAGNREKYFDDGGFRSLYDNEKSRLISHAALLEEMGKNGIAGALCMGFPWEHGERCRYQNEYLGMIAAENAGVLYAFGSVPFRDGSVYNIVNEISSLGLHGIGEIGFYGWDDAAAQERYLREIFDCAGTFTLPVCLHVNEPVGHRYPGKYDTSMAMLYDIIAGYPDVTVILAHWGGGILFYELMPEVKMAFGNVFYDTAATPYLYDPAVYSAALAIVSSRKILFGSDYPLLAPGRYFRAMEEQIFEQRDRENILFRNALRILEG
ncbi:MAG TPA: TatD family hydrolase [Spirochaetota bacterium]|nr:TatD family hydrolase [Spirochaetota bacterium]